MNRPVPVIFTFLSCIPRRFLSNGLLKGITVHSQVYDAFIKVVSIAFEYQSPIPRQIQSDVVHYVVQMLYRCCIVAIAETSDATRPRRPTTIKSVLVV